ncbi:unnamed protein product [Brugia timori]|uniref:Uncharacterized protein n=1 Tax=Brugia timori TaxID=42155 RepID=A0A0R3R9J9_9BILA|nr:unnamed protein product [Brugia timori]
MIHFVGECEDFFDEDVLNPSCCPIPESGMNDNSADVILNAIY